MKPTRIHPELGDEPIRQTANERQKDGFGSDTVRIEGHTVWLRHSDNHGAWEPHTYPLDPVPDDDSLRDSDFNRSRLTWALDSHGLEGPVVDLAVDAADPEVDWWESGAAVPTREQVRRCAALTGHPLAWFYKPDVLTGEVFTCSMD